MTFTKLNRAGIRKLKIGEKVTEAGITAERLPNGDVRYEVNVMVDGQRIHRIVGRESDGTTRTQGEQLIERLRTEARENRLQLPQGRKLALALSKASEDYLTKLEQSGGRNMVPKKRHFRKYLAPAFGNKRLDQFCSFDLEKYRHDRRATGVSDATINLELASLSHLFNKAIEWGWIREMPCKIKMARKSLYVAAVLTDTESDALIRAAMGDADPDAWLFIAIGMHTGMRHREILRMRFEHIDSASRRLHVPHAKAGARLQPLTQEIVDILVRERDMRTEDGTGWVFPTTRPSASKKGHRDRISKSFRRIVKTAELDPVRVTPHTLRHTAVTNLVKSGVDLLTIQQISGHASLQMVLHYAKIHAPHIDRAMTRLSRPLPSPPVVETENTITQELHKAPLRLITSGRQKVAKA